MPRKLRLDEAGGYCHVLNRGNYRQNIFKDERAKETFERTLFEACERAGWRLHAYCIMSNHYHLALETPQGNLSEGMRWLQSVFARRFNGFRKESGHLFEGRFKSLTVENDDRMAWLSHYIHLNPVRGGLCPMVGLSDYRWSSFWHMQQKSKRPTVLNLKTCLEGAGGLKDGPAGRRKYGEYLNWLQEDKPARKEMAFDQMSKGWAIGTRQYQVETAVDNRKMRPRIKRSYAEARKERNMRWETTLDRCLEIVGKKKRDGAKDLKSADWKVGIAAFMKRHEMTTNAWLKDRLNMGTDAGVSRYATEAIAGSRPNAAKYFRKLSAKIKY
jgi:putative transposase